MRPGWVKALPVVVAFAGIAIAYGCYVLWPSLPAVFATLFRPIHLLWYRKWYFDELFDAIVVRPSLVIGRGFWKGGDGALIDGVGADGIARATLDIARRAGRMQTGYLYHYAFAMLIGVVALVSWYLFSIVG